MPIAISNKPQLTGVIILFVGVALLVFTFINAFLFLQEPFGLFATGDLARVFGEALAPLIQACTRLMYLGIMGWIGSMLTVRGIPLVTHKHVAIAESIPPAQPEQEPRATKQPAPTPKPQPKPTPTPKPQPKLTPVSPRATQQQKPAPAPESSQERKPASPPKPQLAPEQSTQRAYQPTQRTNQPVSHSVQPKQQPLSSTPTGQTSPSQPTQAVHEQPKEPKAILIPPEEQREE
ncbi:MAG: hypothetical protein JSV64_00065 [Candidatus Bathyarchaeota archaeon]|nr:MAG: hypothetical protein JSV64_00065 [Candidatus Bathyarchaeota archaeon]